MKTIWLSVLFCFISIPLFAQVVNPTTVNFTHVDFAATDSYVIGYFSSATATMPVQEAPFPKPANCNPCSGPLPSRPTAFQNWWVGARAVAGSTTSVWSNLVPFVRVPLAPVVTSVQ